MTQTCPVCHGSKSIGDRFCTSCGHAFDPNPAAELTAFRAVARASVEAASGRTLENYDGVVPTCLVTDAETAEALETMPI